MIEEESICRTDDAGNKVWVNFYGYSHRLDDLPAYVDAAGAKEWYVNGKRHRDNDQPAVIGAYGSQLWYVDGKRHRINGLPAVIRADGTQWWWVNDINITEQVLAWHKTNNIKYPPTTPEEEEELAVLFKLTFLDNVLCN